MVSPIDPTRVYDFAVAGAGPAGLATAVYAGSEGLPSWCSTAARSAVKLAPQPGSRTIWAFRPRSPATACDED
jgi:thioredoxin reductase